VNDVHEVTARKLRAFATAIRAERYGPHEFGVREAMEAEAVELEKRADSIEEQVKPAIEEPIAFGYKLGASDFIFAALLKLRVLRSEAITSERKNAYDVAIKTVEELLP
jgi:hypothetical protein